MKREVIQDFLNLPGIAGVALMDGRSRPYFCGVDQSLNFQQKAALAQGILQVVETIPEGFEAFEFQFAGHQVHIYKLDRGIILLVLINGDQPHTGYRKAFESLKAILQEDISNAIATFRLIAGNTSSSGSNDLGQKLLHVGTAINADDRSTASQAEAPSPELAVPGLADNGLADNGNLPLPPNPPPPTLTSPERSPAAPMAVSADLGTLLSALNHLSQFTTKYLGNQVIVNYWKATRPKENWLNYFQLDRAAKISFTGTTQPTQPLSTQELQWVREWVAAFIKRCAQVIRDFPTLVEQKALDSEQKALLLG